MSPNSKGELMFLAIIFIPLVIYGILILVVLAVKWGPR